MKTRGGKRAGAGRKPTGHARERISITIDSELLVWAKKQPGYISDVIKIALVTLRQQNERIK